MLTGIALLVGGLVATGIGLWRVRKEHRERRQDVALMNGVVAIIVGVVCVIYVLTELL